MNKRGQFYIIAALIIAAIVATLIAEVNYARRQPKPIKFEELSEDFEAEVTKIIDSGIYSGKTKGEIDIEIRGFTRRFLEYAQERNPDIQLVYLYGNENELSVVNYAFNASTLTTKTLQMVNLTGGGGTAVSTVKIELGEKTFTRAVEERMEHFKDISATVQNPGEWAKLRVAGVVHDFDLASMDKFYYMIESQGRVDKREVYITREPPTVGVQ